MPYMLISTQTRLETGPTFVGDSETADPALMALLEARPQRQLGNNFDQFVSPHTPSRVLNLVETLGWKVVAMSGIGQTCVWTLYKENKD